MKRENKVRKKCSNGHVYYKSSSCPVCPICEKSRTDLGIFHCLSAPARRALESQQILTVEDLTTYTADEILALHGVGKTTIPKLLEMLGNEGLNFKSKS